MPSFGPKLRRAREKRGVTFDDVARETRLSKRYLVALEEEAIAKLPGGTYNRAYLRSYATFLRVDPESLLQAYAAEEARLATVSEEEMLATMNRALDQRHGQADARNGLLARLADRRLGPAIAVALLGALVLGGAAWVGLQRFGSPARTPAAPAAQAAVAVSDTGQPAASEPAVERPDRRESVRQAEPAIRIRPVSDQGRASHLAIAGSGVGTGVVDRQLVGKSDRFSAGSRVVFWTHVLGGRAGDTIDHVWFRDGTIVGAASLSVGSPDWRTQSRRVLDPPGEWVVEARDADGHVLVRHEFHAGT
jgi:cytoskeletal protein RodZ